MTHSHIPFLAVVRYLYSLPSRQLEGFARALHRLVPSLPSGDYSGLRRRILGLDPSEHLRKVEESLTIAVDSTGVKVNRAGG